MGTYTYTYVISLNIYLHEVNLTEHFISLCRVTVLKDDARRSKGVAFVMFIEKESATKAVRALNKTEV